MSSLHDQLIDCFKAVFPDLPETEIPTASMDVVDTWDSLSALQLVAVLEETFGVAVPVTQLPELSSFAKVEALLKAKTE